MPFYGPPQHLWSLGKELAYSLLTKCEAVDMMCIKDFIKTNFLPSQPLFEYRRDIPHIAKPRNRSAANVVNPDR